MLQVNTIGLTTSGVAVGAVGAHQGAATAAAMPAVSALTPSGLDEVSAFADTAYSAQGQDI
ncbi:PE domain-containing protein, partial [Mycobacterium timonense]